MKKLLVLCFLSLAIDQFGGMNLFRQVAVALTPSDGFHWGFTIAMNVTSFVSYFWKFGFPIFFASLFPKTSRSAWWIIPLVICWLTARVINDLVWWQVYTNQVWWWTYKVNEWVFDSIYFLTTFAWIFYGGLVFQKAIAGFNFTQFPGFNLKDWYQNLIKEQ